MALTGDTPDVDPYPGFELRVDTVAVSAQEQSEKLALIGIDPAAFGNDADPSFFIGLGIRAGVNSGVSAEGGINMVQSLVVHRKPQLDEALEVGGRVRSVSEVPRGQSVDTEVWFKDAGGAPVVNADRISLRPGPQRSGGRGAGDRPPPVVPDTAALELGPSYGLTPEIVCAYSSEGNSIHYDLESARAAGFRAPLIGGGMGVHYLLAHLWEAKRPTAFACEIYFRRPIFWDAR